MKRFVLALTLCLLGPLSLLAHGQNVPEIPFESVSNFLKLPADMYLGEAAGVAVNSKGHVFVLSRGNSTGPGVWRERYATSGVRFRWDVSARDWPQPVRVVVRACREGR